MKRLLLLCAAVVGLMLSVQRSHAGIMGSATLNADGSYTYSYTVANTGGAAAVAAWSLEFSLAPDWSQDDLSFGGDVQVPANWAAAAGIPFLQPYSQDFFSLDPGADVAVGALLTGFSFTSFNAPGVGTYFEYAADGASTRGSTVAPAAVPDGDWAETGWLALGLLVSAHWFGTPGKSGRWVRRRTRGKLALWMPLLMVFGGLTRVEAVGKGPPTVLTIQSLPAELHPGQAYSLVVLTSPDVISGYVYVDFRPTAALMPRLILGNPEVAAGGLRWTASGVVPANLNPGPGAAVTFRAFVLDSARQQGRLERTTAFSPQVACDEFGSYGPADWPLARAVCRSGHVLEVGRSLANVIRIDVLNLRVFDGPSGSFISSDCPPGYSYCIENDNDGNGNAVKLGVVECDGFGSYGPSVWAAAREVCRSGHVLEVGRSLATVIRIDLLSLGVFDGPGGSLISADCPPGYSYCIENHNDGNGNSVKLGVVEVEPVDCMVGEWYPVSDCDPATGLRLFHRDVLVEAQNGGQPCPSLEELLPCPVDCVVGDWYPFGDCRPDQDTRTWHRDVLIEAKNGGNGCPALEEERPAFGDWHSVGPVDPCTGSQLFGRDPLPLPNMPGFACPDSMFELRQVAAPDCMYGEWHALGDCSPFTGQETYVRYLVTDCPNCPEYQTEMRSCDCECVYGDWQKIADCNPFTGKETYVRYLAKFCVFCEEFQIDERPCGEGCVYGDWYKVEDCDPSTGQEKYRRDVLYSFGEDCPSQEEMRDCPVDCVLGDWMPTGYQIYFLGQWYEEQVQEILVEAKNGGYSCFPETRFVPM